MWETFSSIFDGLEEAFGTYKIDKTQTNGKKSGRASLVREPRTKDHWLGHLSGQGDLSVSSRSTLTHSVSGGA